MDTKRCSKCNERKNVDCFYESRNKDGRRADCIECANKHRRTLYHSNRGDIGYRLAKLLDGARKRAKKFDRECTITKDFLLSLWDSQGCLCAITGMPLDLASSGVNSNSPSVDRIDSNLGYIPGNVQLVCSWANTMKSSFSEEELLDKVIIMKEYLEAKLGR